MDTTASTPEDRPAPAGLSADDRPQNAPTPTRDPWSSKRRNTRPFTVTSEINEINRFSRVGLTLKEVIADEVDDYREGLRFDVELGVTPRQYAASEEDRAIWAGSRLLAVMRAREKDGGFEVIRLVDDDGNAVSTAVEVFPVADLLGKEATDGQ